ncbi:membrane protein [Flavisolibacter tropicus]|uniref:Membrane protein n=1 Tax=Flavisolibacter tropicus TaxID=1492898 RepID=A0A172U1L3_9BACT|nr:membrane protein [Flavisolibacter tropicus]
MLVTENKAITEYRLIKKGIWAYFILLILEGALRKWAFPSLATPLLVVRDPIAIWLVLLAWKNGLLPLSAILTLIILIGIIGIYTAVFTGHGSLPVAFFGARILLFHFPLMYVIGSVFSREDVIKLGKVLLLLSIPMAILITLQFFSPQSAWVNKGIGGEGSGGFSGANGYYRPPATFSFTNGTSLFFAFAGSYLFYFWLNLKRINSFLLFGASIALLIAIPFSISRGLLFHVSVTLIFAILAIFRKPKFMGKMMIIGFLLIAVISFLSKYSFFQTATEAFTARFEHANDAEGGLNGVLADRYLGGMIGALNESSNYPFFGYGIGMGTNVGSMLLSGQRTYLIAEGEWGRLIGELGFLMGLFVILIRLGFSLRIALASYVKLVQGDLLPWMLLSFGLLTIPQAQWAQPTALGFSTLIGGLILASVKKDDRSTQQESIN